MKKWMLFKKADNSDIYFWSEENKHTTIKVSGDATIRYDQLLKKDVPPMLIQCWINNHRAFYADGATFEVIASGTM